MQTVNLFVYGSLKRGYNNHQLLKSCAIDIQKATTKGTLYDIKLGFPAMRTTGNYTIHGQLAKIPQQYLLYFDQFEGVPRFYQRETITVTIEDNKKENAYAYTMKVLPMNSTIIGSGIW